MLALAAAFALAAGAAEPPAPVAAPSPSAVLELRVVRRDGTATTLREVAAGAPTVLAFWATYCPPCRAEVPALNRAAAKWRERGLRVVGVALETDAKRVAEARDAWGMEYDTVRLAAGEESRAEALFPRGLPTSALVARGALTWHERLLTDEALERLVPPLLGDQ